MELLSRARRSRRRRALLTAVVLVCAASSAPTLSVATNPALPLVLRRAVSAAALPAALIKVLVAKGTVALTDGLLAFSPRILSLGNLC